MKIIEIDIIKGFTIDSCSYYSKHTQHNFTYMWLMVDISILHILLLKLVQM